MILATPESHAANQADWKARNAWSAAKPRWEVIRVTETLDYFEGIEADNSEEARRKWLEGEGKLNPDRQELPPWTLKVVRVG